MSADARFKVVTTDGTSVNKGHEGGGLDKEQATGDAARRNAKAEKLGIETRYEIAELSS